MEDQKLLRRLKRGDPAALEAVIRKYTPYLCAIVSNVMRSQLGQEDIEETISDVFLTLWNRRMELNPASLRAYLAAMARNAAVNRLRALKLTVPLDDDVLQLRDETAGLEPALLQRELEKAVHEAVEALPPEDREIFRRYYFYFQRTGEIARDMGLTESTVTTRLHRGRKKLRSYLTERGYCDG